MTQRNDGRPKKPLSETAVTFPKLARIALACMTTSILLMPLLATPVQADTVLVPIKITNAAANELYTLTWKSAGYSKTTNKEQWLVNCSPSMYCPKFIAAPNQYMNSDGSLTVCGWNQAFCGECATFTQVASGAGPTRNWHAGNWALSGRLTWGDVIATFDSSGRYPKSGNHAAIFYSYERDSQGKILGMWVVDQNAVPYAYSGKVGLHFIPAKVGVSVQYQTPSLANGYWQVLDERQYYYNYA